MSQPLVSVVVPNYNHAKFIRQRLLSIFDQSYQNFEVIILDDHSDDDSLIEIEPFLSDRRVRLYVNSENSGSPFKQWCKGIGLARGEYIWVAESDDYADSSFLESMTRVINLSGVGLVYCRSTDVDRCSQPLGFSDDHVDISRAIPLDESIFTFSCGMDFIRLALLEKNSIVNASAVLFRSSVIKKFIFSLTCHKYLGDWILYTLCIGKEGVALLDKPLNFFRKHQSTTRYAKKNSEEWEVLRREYLTVYDLLRQVGAIDDNRHRQISAQTSQKITNRARFDSSFDVGLIIKEHRPSQEIIIWGAGTIGSFIAESLVMAGIPANFISFIDSKYQNVTILGKNYCSKPVEAHLKNLSNPSDSLLILASLESADVMLSRIKELRLNIPVLQAMSCTN
jgi:glycosyltransferase involved in cell wall biosynthesis